MTLQSDLKTPTGERFNLSRVVLKNRQTPDDEKGTEEKKEDVSSVLNQREKDERTSSDRLSDCQTDGQTDRKQRLLHLYLHSLDIQEAEISPAS